MLKKLIGLALQEVIFSFQAILSNIERDAKHEESSHFRQACRAREIEHVLIKFSTELMFVYKVYSGMDVAGADEPGGESSSLDSLNLIEFFTMIRDAGIQDVNLTKPEIINIFIYVQDDGSIINEPREENADAREGHHAHHGGPVPAGQPMPDDTEMDYGEFCEALCGCACYKTLDPYITMPQKLEFLIIKNIVPLFHALKEGKVPSMAHAQVSPQAVTRGKQAAHRKRPQLTGGTLAATPGLIRADGGVTARPRGVVGMCACRDGLRASE